MAVQGVIPNNPTLLTTVPTNDIDQINLNVAPTTTGNNVFPNMPIPVQPVVMPPRTDHDLPPVMTAAKYGALFPHVAVRGKDLLHVLVHGAANLPLVDGRQPRCYVTVQSRSSMATQDIGETINATNVIEGVTPHWNEMIYADIPEENNHAEEVIILIIDEPRQRTIAEHRFPWRWLEPFYQYHLNLQHTIKQTTQTTSLFISIMRKQSSLSKEDIRYFGLEILLNRFDVTVPKKQVLYAVGRIIPDYESYKHEFLRNLDNPKLGIDFKKILIPTAQDFALPNYSFTGYPQTSLASKESKIPTWLHDYLFSHENEKDNMFSNNSALIIEFYPFQAISNNPNWRIKSLVGWVAIRLDTRAYDALTAPGSSEGVRTEGLLVESDGGLVSENTKFLTAEVLLRLVPERHPVKNLLAYTASNLPVLPSYYVEGVRQGGAQPLYMQVVSQKKVFLPTIQSPVPQVPLTQAPLPQMPLAQTVINPNVPMGQPTMLPSQYYYPQQYEVVPTFTQVERPDGIRFRVPRINPYDLDDIPTEYRAMLATNYPPRRDEDIDGWFEYFQREVSVYKQAIRRVIQDVVQLRDQHKTLTAANHDLKVKMENFDKKKRVLYEIFEGDKIDKAKMQDIFNRLSAKISAQTLELKENHAKITNFEKELARRGELRAQYDALVRTTQAREVEIKMMKERLAKADGLEETVRRQELVIEKLEAMITNYMKEKRLRGAFSDSDRTFLSEHAALGLESQQLQRRIPPARYSASVMNQREDLVKQNLSYQQELANLKARFQENASAWGREKAELMTKINDIDRPVYTPRPRKLEPI
ncbi:unnamed protein product [Rotaria magnacalcarata]|uniref:C2 domain-containing protein n=8 Tax=Rotaria magnacalcarata TaxID=392030 RepID=A0A816RAS0_9BILA|nr:unnamed protein product [Rotaria magnacalcarata]CAF2068757.1 unnamed protein product [Rotaria magnacalcarata]CAF3790668.1 unnamed protein product [Rotaria magnacalcarata]CAF3862410.1 unnamed protein product [Rotaria magnacalcarata]